MTQAFTRCAHQEPDNGEAWNNIAAIHLQLQHPPQAFSALSEAVKYNRDSWQTWSNYGQAAAQTGNGLPAARAVQKASTCHYIALSAPITYCHCLLLDLCKRQAPAVQWAAAAHQACCVIACWCSWARAEQLRFDCPGLALLVCLWVLLPQLHVCAAPYTLSCHCLLPQVSSTALTMMTSPEAAPKMDEQSKMTAMSLISKLVSN